MKNLIAYFLLFSFLIVCTTRCARKGSPTGGPNDTIGPVMVTAYPPYKTTNFNSKKIKLSFDEYVKFKDLQKQLIISPPFKNMPVIKPQATPGKEITIEILDTLKANTTYAFNFGNSIVDNNEGNPLGSFKYVFSTGDFVDSLEVKGMVKDAIKRKTEKNISVLLYEWNDQFYDSIIYKEKPVYVTNTLDSTFYNITNIKTGKYKLIAMRDPSNNYMYNPSLDEIAFHNEPITLPQDSIIPLQLFKEDKPFKWKRPLENKKGKIIFGFEGKKENLTIELLSKTPENFKKTISMEKGKDTLNFWYTPFEADSLQFRISNKKYEDFFTVKLRTSKTDSLTVLPNIKGVFHPKDTFALETNIPIETFDITKISIYDKDTLSVPFTANLDVNKTKLALLFNRKTKNSYQIDVLPNALIDFYGATNDTIQNSLRTLDVEDYGILELQLANVKEFPILVDLVDQNEKLIERQFATKETAFTFKNIEPNTYFVRVIFDKNNNKDWDTGNYLKAIQPERVEYFATEIKLRANWVINETFTLKE